MPAMTKQDVHAFLADQIVEQVATQGREISMNDLSYDRDLLLSGLIDSLGLLELTAALEDYCGFELDFELLYPEQLTVVGPLCEFVAVQAASQRT